MTVQTKKREQDLCLERTTAATAFRERRTFPFAVVILLLFAGLAMAAFSLAITPTKAYAKSYTMPKVDIVANAATDGSLNVVENRTFDFDGTYSAVWWTFSNLPSNANFKVNSIGVTRVDESGKALGQTTQLPATAFQLSWRDSGGPSKSSYSVDVGKDTVYVFFSATDEKLVITLDYTIVNGVQAYKDVGDIYWKYVGDQWAVASENVTMTLALPVPQGVTVTPGDNVRAWGHGPLDGTVTVNTDGTVDYKVAEVKAGQYAEARVIFPTSWLTNLSGEASLIHIGDAHFEDVLTQERAWADQANRQRILSLAFIIACAVITLLVLIWAIRSFFKYGKEHASNFTDEYWRDVPSAQDHPAVIARLRRWNKESSDDFTATLMYLSHKGAIQINKGNYEKQGTFGSKTIDDYYLTRVPAVADTLTNPIDKKAMEFLFDTIAGGADSLWFGSIQTYGKEHPKKFTARMSEWQGIVTAETNKREFFEVKSQKKQTQMISVVILLVVLGIASFVLLSNYIPFFFILPLVIVLLLIANYMPRRSVEGNDLEAKCTALRKWLKDFTLLNEKPPTDVKVWGELMVYAFMFGIADKVIADLKLRVPELFEESTAVMGGYYVPWYFWYMSSAGMHGGVMPAASSMFQTSFANTVQTAQAAVSGAGGNFSSGGGFGGGFSGGGGGGFGGGGGAR